MGKSHLPVPDYSTLCRRQNSLPVEIEDRLASGEKLAAGIDSTGLKVYGEGEWKVHKHGTKRWKEENGYHRRSLNEVVMFRYKTIFGGELDARTLKNQQTEVKLKCLALNKFIGIGMPDAYKASSFTTKRQKRKYRLEYRCNKVLFNGESER